MALTVALCVGAAVLLLGWRAPVRPLVELSAWAQLLRPRQSGQKPQRTRRSPSWVAVVPHGLTELIKRVRQEGLNGPDPLARQLMYARLDDLVTPEQIIGLRIVAPLGLGGITFLTYLINPAPYRLIMVFGGVVIGFLMPDHWLKQQVRKHRRAVRRELPSVLTTLGVLLDAGMNLVPAIKEIGERRNGALVERLQEAIRENELGTPLSEALMGTAERCGVQEFTLFMSVLTQSMSKGASGVSEAVREQSRQIWKLRQQQVQEIGHELSQDLFMILTFLAFPAAAIFMLGPVGIAIYRMLVN